MTSATRSSFPTASTPSASGRNGPSSAAINILIVDDVQHNLVALEALLGRPGLNILRASSGAEALEWLLSDDVALALIDVQMPDMDGFELAELMRGSPRTREVPIIFLTATDRDTTRAFRGYDAGAVDFLYKPFDPQILRSKVEVFVQLQAQKVQLATQLETVKKMVHDNEMFMAVLGHDLRNPLSAIMASAEVLKRLNGPARSAEDRPHDSLGGSLKGSAESNPERDAQHDRERIAACAERIACSGTRMAKMIEQLLDVARMRSGQLTVTPVQTDLRNVSQSIINEFTAVTDPARIEFACDGDTTGFWDPDRLSQVLSNLVGNALHHGHADRPVRVHIDARGADEVSFTVSNDGVIPDHARAHLFEPFTSGSANAEPTQATPSSQTSQGLGLGLYIASELVRMHHGTIDLRSSEAEGTVFKVVLPKQAKSTDIRAALKQRSLFSG